MMILNLWDLILPLTVVFCGLWMFALKCKHLLNTLLSLEFIMLGVFFVLVMGFNNLYSEAYMILFFMCMVACEGALGLSLLVCVVRTHGNDYFSSFGILEC